jgi:2-phospho-L-lactate guanylyltransferase
VTLVPDRRDNGTNVIAVPTDCEFVFSYGPGSFSRHVAEARRLGVALRIVRTGPLSWDVDVPTDLGAVPAL